MARKNNRTQPVLREGTVLLDFPQDITRRTRRASRRRQHTAWI